MRIIILSIFCVYTASCAEKEDFKTNPLPYFRRKVEEITDETPVEKVTDDSHSNLLSLLVKNVKELFNELDGDVKGDSHYHVETTLSTIEVKTEEHTPFTTDTDTEDVVNIKTESEPVVNVLRSEPDVKDFGSLDPASNEFSGVAPEVLTTTRKPYSRNKDWVNVENTNDIMLYENISLIHAVDHLNEPTPSEVLDIVQTTKYYTVIKKAKELKSIEKSKPSYHGSVIPDVTPLTSISSYLLESTDFISREEPNKTCIYCDNIITDNCNDPKNKIVPSIVCKRESDLCYSLHTPFGLVDRGCFNINHNVTTYVCSCNLCNYISISEMPYFFSHKKDWIDNVLELSHTRNLRQSLFKEMACLRCEANTTIKTRAMVESVNCLEGNIEHLPVEECQANEICGVRAKRSDGYIWRGCIKKPLYNYWISLCDQDLCNFDKLLTIYHP